MAHDRTDLTVDLKTERLNELAFSFKKTGALVLALELELFTHIDEGRRTVSAIADALGLDEEMVDRVVSVCKALDLVMDDDGELTNLSDVSRYLVKGKRGYVGDYLMYQPISEYDGFKNLAQHYVVPTAPPRQKGSYVAMMEDAERARRFTTSGYNGSIGLAYKLTKVFDFGQYRHWLDVAGGSGVYSIAACERNPDLRTTILDFPNVAVVTREFVAKHGLSERIATLEGNFFDVPFPDDCDLISFITPLQSYVPDEIIRVLRKTHDALTSGGTCLVIDYMLDDDKSGPLDPAFINLEGLRKGHYTGRVQSGAEYVALFEQAGFKEVRVEWLMRHQLGLVHANKPE